jgi:carboxylesterase
MTVEKDHSYYIRGNRVGVLLIHGLGGTPAEMRYVANGLARAGYTIFCPQLAGHCGTEEDIKRTTWLDWYASAEKALFELRKDCDTVVVGGLSAGAVLALLLAARNAKDVHGVALFAPVFWLNGWVIPWRMRLFRTVRHKWIANLFNFPDTEPHGIKDDRVREFVRQALSSGDTSTAGISATPGGVVLEHRRLAKVTREELDNVRQPTLIVHPREDDYADLNNAWYVQRHVKGLVDMVVLDDSYHIVTIDRQRHVVVDRATTFIETVTKRARERTPKAAAKGSMEEAPQTITVKPVPAAASTVS